MPNLSSTLATVLFARYTSNTARIRELAAPLTETEFWHKPFPFGNSFGHLVLHLTGNLNYYIGARIASTGYIRNRPQEFSDPKPPSKDTALQGFDEAVRVVLRTIQSQSADDWSAAYTGEGSDASTRLTMVVQCAAHMQHHIGQMIYLVHEMKRQAG
jgi:uncharacterized damage-inducible protein DinB